MEGEEIRCTSLFSYFTNPSKVSNKFSVSVKFPCQTQAKEIAQLPSFTSTLHSPKHFLKLVGRG